MSQITLSCFHCNRTALFENPGSSAPIGFRESCPHCHADTHVCRNCTHYDAGAHHECRESNAEWVRNKERGNRCEYFRGRESSENSPCAGAPATSAADRLKALDDLFRK